MADNWLEELEYLPDFMRDFHDAKDFFKTVVEWGYSGNDKTPEFDKVNFRQAMIFTIDKFLWFMAAHGYTLQRSRKRKKFGDIHKTLREYANKRFERDAAGIRALMKQGQEA